MIALYNWALAAYSWSSLTTASGDLTREIKNGRSNADGTAILGTEPPPDWDIGIIPQGWELGDGRNYGTE